MMRKVVFETRRVGADHRLEVEVPPEFGTRVKLIILPDNDTDESKESYGLMALQEKSDFAISILADNAEDVWNDL